MRFRTSIQLSEFGNDEAEEGEVVEVAEGGEIGEVGSFRIRGLMWPHKGLPGELAGHGSVSGKTKGNW
jgi:hypothetical protein